MPGGFCCSLDVLYGAIGKSKLQFFFKIYIKISIFGHQNPGSRSGSASGSVLTKNAGYEFGFALKPMRIQNTAFSSLCSRIGTHILGGGGATTEKSLVFFTVFGFYGQMHLLSVFLPAGNFDIHVLHELWA
jgi:hypothetical protein